jgi:hypothetical protein
MAKYATSGSNPAVAHAVASASDFRTKAALATATMISSKSGANFANGKNAIRFTGCPTA